MDELSLLNQQETNQRKGEKLLNHKQIVNSFLLLFDSKLNSVTTGWDEQWGRGSLDWVERVRCEEHALPSAAACLQIHLGHPATVIVNRAVERALMSPTEKTSQRDDNVLKLLKVLLLLKQVLAYFTRTMTVTWLSVLAVKQHRCTSWPVAALIADSPTHIVPFQSLPVKAQKFILTKHHWPLCYFKQCYSGKQWQMW